MGQYYNSCFIERNTCCLIGEAEVARLRAMNLGGRVRKVRESLGWTQTALAEKVEGLSQQNLGVMEKRDAKTSEFAVKLADALGVSLRWLLTGDGRQDDPDWPFPRVLQSRWDACDDTDRGYVQAAINKALDECEAARPFATPEKVPRLAA